MTLLLTCESISKSYGYPLFDEISLGIFQGDKIGLIGPNGSGKSTLLKIIAGIETPDKGKVSRRREVKIGYVPQTSHYPEQSLEEILLQVLINEKIPDEQQRKILVSKTLSKLGFEDPEQMAHTLSGGWKKRLDIARELVKSPDILLLDEPTNHLDLEGIKWLEKFLQRESLTFVVISHDRYFMENVTTKIIELNRIYPKGVFLVEGSYTQFIEKQEEFINGQLQQQKALASKVRNEVEWLRQSPKARTTKSQSRVQRAENLIQELAEVKSRNKQQRLQIDFSSTDRLTRKLLAAKNLSKTIQDRKLFSHIEFTLSPGVRLGIAGGNGTGKTTLLKILLGEVKPDLGTIKYADGIKLVYFDQHRIEVPPQTPLRQALSPNSDHVNYRGQSIHINSWCKKFLFSPDKLDLPVGQLSGGEKARVHLARFMLQPADILLLDEPTNDLDIPTLEILEESLLEFPGAVVLITHDRCLMDNICTAVIGLGGLGEDYIFADFNQWEKYQKLQTDLLASSKPSKIPSAEEKKAPRTSSGPAKLSFKEKMELEKMEQKILILEEKINSLQQLIHDPAHAIDTHQLNLSCEELHNCQEELNQLFHRWAELEEKGRV